MKTNKTLTKYLYRVVKHNWQTNETLFVSEAKPIEELKEIYKSQVNTLGERGENTILVKFTLDHGNDYDYTQCGGIFIVLHNEHWWSSNW